MYELVVFICGLVVMAVELAGVRIMSPYYGGTHIVYTSIIGVIMTSLSIGYWLGGKLSKKSPNSLTLSIIVFVSGLYILALALCQFEFLKATLSLSKIPFILRTLICALIMFTLPSILLGIVSPYTIQIAINQRNNNINDAGSIVGRFYAISTIGSIIGTFLTGFYLIVWFGIDRIFIALSFILFLCSVISIISAKFQKKKS